jgi:uncharacterized protein (TIGR03437 family)
MRGAKHNRMIFRLLASLPILSACAFAQFFGLATTGDGSQLYFATPLRQKDTTTPQPDYGKLFRIDASGLSLQESRAYQVPQPLPGDPGLGPYSYSLSNAYDFQFADVSSDGQVVAATALQDCIGPGCYRLNLGVVTTIAASGGSHDYPFELRLSANGKWAFGESGTTLGFADGILVNVVTGEQTALGGPSLGLRSFQVAGSGRPIANDGTAVFSDDQAVVVLQGSQTLRIPAQYPQDAVIDAGAHTIVYSGYSKSLSVADAVTGMSTLLVPDGYSPSIADGGQTVLYLSSRSGAPQAYVIQTDGSGDSAITSDPLGIARAILSGDGSTAYAVTLGGRLIKITVASGEIDEVIPRTPYVDAGQGTAPGRLTTFTGEGLSDIALSAAPPLAYTLDNAEVTIQGQPTLMASIQPNSLTVLTPTGVTPTPVPGTFPAAAAASLQLDVASISPFAGPRVPVSIAVLSPTFLWQNGNQYISAAHEDWSGLVTAANPAHPGEVVHAYALGLGVTTPAVPYGAPAPAQEPLARLINAPFQCGYYSKTIEAVEILFQGLAPNLVGIFQIDWRIPLDLPAADFSIFCQIPGIQFFALYYFTGTIPVGFSSCRTELALLVNFAKLCPASCFWVLSRTKLVLDLRNAEADQKSRLRTDCPQALGGQFRRRVFERQGHCRMLRNSVALAGQDPAKADEIGYAAIPAGDQRRLPVGAGGEPDYGSGGDTRHRRADHPDVLLHGAWRV